MTTYTETLTSKWRIYKMDAPHRDEESLCFDERAGTVGSFGLAQNSQVNA